MRNVTPGARFLSNNCDAPVSCRQMTATLDRVKSDPVSIETWGSSDTGTTSSAVSAAAQPPHISENASRASHSPRRTSPDHFRYRLPGCLYPGFSRPPSQIQLRANGSPRSQKLPMPSSQPPS